VDYLFPWFNTTANTITVTLADFDRNPVVLRIAVIENIPVSAIDDGNLLTYRNPRTQNTSRIRISWNNNNGIRGLTSTDSWDASLSNATVSFNVLLSATTQRTPDRTFDFLDGVIVFLIFSSVVMLTSGASYFINRAQQRRRRMILMMHELEAMPQYPPPNLYPFVLNLEESKMDKQVPMSIECFQGPFQKEMQATSFVVLMPGTPLYLAQGDLPKFGIGTRIIKRKTTASERIKK
jgi:hypothetical protein